jgi:hypothetical protein
MTKPFAKRDPDLEREFRNGVGRGVRLAAEAIAKSKKTDKNKIYDDLIKYIDGPLRKWFLGDTTKHIEPPKLKL